MSEQLKKQLYDVLSGKSKVRHGEAIQAITCYLGQGPKAGPAIEGTKHFKEQEKQRLEQYIDEHLLWHTDVDISKYVSEGAEQKVYLKDNKHVLKLND